MMDSLGHAGVHLPDLYVAGMSVLGLLIAIRQLGGPDPFSQSFRAILVLTAVFTTARAGFWWTGSNLLRGINLAAAAMIPLAALIFAEVLLRRHAPLWMKWSVSGLGVVLAAMTLLVGEEAFPRSGAILIAYQLAALTGICALVLGRDRGSLRQDENAMIDRISISFPFVLLFLASDYDLGPGAEPLRLSGVAVLVACWIGLGLRQAQTRRFATLKAVGLALGLSLITTLAVAIQLAPGAVDAARIWGVISSTMILAAILKEAAALRDVERRRAFLPTPGREAGSTSYFDDLRIKGLMDDVLLVEGPDLADFDASVLEAMFQSRSCIALADLPPAGAERTLAESQMRALLERHEAAQAHLLGRTPFRLALVRAAGPLGANPDPTLQMAFALTRALDVRAAQLLAEPATPRAELILERHIE
jgi:hypothetical protein